VAEEVSIAVFTRRMESLLDCGTKTDGASASEWVLKYSAPISSFGSVEEVRRLLCDKIASLDAETGETIGVLKVRRRSVQAGHAKVRLVPADDSLQLVCRHQTAQGLKAVWKSVLWRLRPQYPAREKGQEVADQPVADQAVVRVVPPSILVREDKGGYYYDQKAAWLSEQGVSVDLNKAIDVTLPLERFAGRDLPYDTAEFYCRVELSRLPAGKPQGISIQGNLIEMYGRHWKDFAQKAKALSDWLGLGWTLPE
jgi:hypothetical protein